MKRTLIKNLEIGQKVKLQGHIQTIRNVSSKLTFIHLRERTGTIQLVFREKLKLNVESVIEIIGVVVENSQSKFNGVEILGESYEVISEGMSELPITINKKEEIPFSTLVEYQALTLRLPERKAIFKIQSEFLRHYREFFIVNGFTEINSTKLVSSGAEGGGNMFEVNYYGEKVYLSQSPQLYKQMMIGVYERVFEIGKVYRAEGSNSNRHLSEFIGLEFEMGFIESYKEIVEMEEQMFNYIFEKLNENCKEELSILGIELMIPGEIPKISYEEVTHILSGEVSGEVSGEAGLTNEQELRLGKYIKEKYNSEFVFVMGYPKSKRPFYTMLNGESTESFELIYKGIEITSGSQRIHNYENLLNRMKELSISTEGFEEYLLAFETGLPPHGGCGIGLERILKQMLNLSNVEEASLIPRTKSRF